MPTQIYFKLEAKLTGEKTSLRRSSSSDNSRLPTYTVLDSVALQNTNEK